MSNTKYTSEQKKEYFKSLRKRWEQTKELAETAKIQAIYKECQDNGIEASARSIAFVYAEMQELGLSGLPYIDVKTFNLWKASGFIVKKGEKSKVKGITWLKSEKKEGADEKDSFVFPKMYNLFHSSQVQAI